MENTPIETVISNTQEVPIIAEIAPVADNEEKKEYNFSLKYGFIEPENRIGRRQFFSRVFIPGIIALLFFALILPFIIRLMFIIVGGSNVFQFLGYIQSIVGIITLLVLPLLYIMMHNTFIKRSRDFGDSGKITKHIVSVLFFGIFINLFISILGGFGIIENGFDLMVLAFTGDLPWWYTANYYLGNITSIVFLLGFLYLCFRKGDTGVNNYGKDPLLSTKIGFFG